MTSRRRSAWWTGRTSLAIDAPFPRGLTIVLAGDIVVGFPTRLEHARGQLALFQLLGELETQKAAIGEAGDFEIILPLDIFHGVHEICRAEVLSKSLPL